MNEEDASITYWAAVAELQSVIESGHRGNKQDVLEELEDDLS